MKPAFQWQAIPGVRLASARAGIRKAEGDDVALIQLAEGSSVAAVFTRNQFCAAPVTVAREHLRLDDPRAWLINAGNANAGTGLGGMDAAYASCEAVAAALNIAPRQVLPFSTGVIGEPLPVDKLAAVVPTLAERLAEDHWEGVARAIMTTDTVPKGACRTLQLSSGEVHIGGIAKGAGMIRPDMATMLAFIATDARLEARELQQGLARALQHSFNRITVDGDTSTNDACVCAASGASGVTLAPNSADETAFFDALAAVCGDLARAIVADGEGATKLVEVRVEGGLSGAECLQVAYTIAHSPLVKTALYASDPNWGRILAAVGRAGIEDLDVDAVHIFLDEVCIVRQGGRADDYREEAGQAVMDRAELTIRVDLGRGQAVESVWTTDLSAEYVRINAEYRT